VLTSLLQGPAYPLLLGALSGVLGTRIGWRLRHRFALPAVQATLGALAFVLGWQAGGAIAGAVAVAAWAVGTSLAAISAFRTAAGEIGTRVLAASAYAASMRGWLESGGPLGSSPGAIVRAHVRELAAYLAAAFLTGNLLSIAMGAVLLNSMNAWFVGLLGAAGDRRTVWFLGWPCWSIARVLAYVVLGSACAQPVATWLGRPAPVDDVRWLVEVGLLGVLLDVVLKIMLSGWYGRRLARSAGSGERMETGCG